MNNAKGVAELINVIVILIRNISTVLTGTVNDLLWTINSKAVFLQQIKGFIVYKLLELLLHYLISIWW